MWARLRSGDRRALSIAAIGVAIVFFFAVNMLAGATLRSARLDLTADGLYTLSDGTRTVLAAIDEPVTLRYYRSRRLEAFGPFFASHAKRVDELLQHYERLAGGKIILERFDPTPYSPEEDLAVADGVQALTLGDGGELAYFGIAGSNSTDDRKAIGYLAPERAAFLEYDLTRLVHDLANPDKPVVAVIGEVPVHGDSEIGARPWLISEVLEQFFRLRMIAGPVDRIDDDVDVLMLAQPAGIDERTLYAVDQFVMRGGRILAFVDPLFEAGATLRAQPQKSAPEVMAPLLAAWGVELPADTVVGDRVAAMRVRARHGGRQVVTDYLAWLDLGPENLVAADAVSGDLKSLVMKTAGRIGPRDGAATRIEPLVLSSPEAGDLDVERLRFMPDPVSLLRTFKPTGERYALAARISGPVTSAFPDGPAAAVENESVRRTHLREATTPLNLILVADADLLADDAWMQTGNVIGQQVSVPTANNADLAVNALENLSGGGALAKLRGRGVTPRRFEVLESMSRRAEDEFRATEATLQARIDQTRSKIRDLQKQEQEGGVLMTAQQQAAIEGFRGELIELRRQLRDVQFALRKDVDSLRTRVEAANILAVPAVVAVAAFTLAALRRRRAARYLATKRAD